MSTHTMSTGGRVFAAVYDLVMWPAERFYLGRLRRELLAGACGRVLEIGAGTGASLPHYPGAAALVATDPDRAMLRRAPLAGRAAALAVGEHLPFAGGSFDTVVSTLTLCTVADPARALAEARRVLRPGGRLLLLEHVRSGDDRAARLQARLTPFWKRIARGCHLDRDTLATARAAGFAIHSLRRLTPVRLFPLVLVEAGKPSDK